MLLNSTGINFCVSLSIMVDDSIHQLVTKIYSSYMFFSSVFFLSSIKVGRCGSHAFHLHLLLFNEL